MNIAQIRKYDVSNGPGIRTTVFVSGCTHNCKGCFNQDNQNFNYGEAYTQEVENIIVDYVKETKRFSLLGGEPFMNKVGCTRLLQKVKETGATIWCWTGYLFEDLYCVEMLNYIDVLVDGKFEIKNKNLKLKFRGSSNQRVIDVKKSLKENKVVIIPDYQL